MAIPWSGYTESGGGPQTLYKYAVEVGERLPEKVFIKLKVSVRLKNWSNYFSFRVGHECKVNGVYQTAIIKNTRKYWGHEWVGSYNSGDGLYWSEGEYDYAGDAWHGPYVVFSGWVPCKMDDTKVAIVPCITRPPICGLGGGGIYAANDLDKTNWKGRSGVWRPWAADEQKGSWAYRALTIDAAFLNNKGLQELSGGATIPKYTRPSKVSGITVSPQSIDVAKQDTQSVTAKWSAPNKATSYKVWINKGSKKVYLGTTSSTKWTVNPKTAMKISEIMNGDKFTFTVMPYDKNGVEASASTTSTAVTYTEVKSIAPNSCYVVGKKGVRNQIFFKGESSSIAYSGDSKGSYPISRYELVRVSDGKKITWTVSQASSASPRKITRTVPSVKRPNVDETYELRAYNTKGRAVYMKNGKWFRFSVHYYGGVLYVYNKKKNKWHEGVAYVYDLSNKKWREAEAVYVRKSGGWKTL